jgi:quinol monooxygenase YgiN
MGFVQIIDFRTSDIDGLKKADEEWEAATEGKRTVRRQIVAQDRNDPSRFVMIVFFDSYESAMENSQLPETQASAEKFAALTEAMSFVDLDVVEDRT